MKGFDLMMFRIIGTTVFFAGIGVGVGLILAGKSSDAAAVATFLGSIGGLIGVVAGAASEIAAALQQQSMCDTNSHSQSQLRKSDSEQGRDQKSDGSLVER